MSLKTSFGLLALLSLTVSLVPAHLAAQDAPSVADAARRARQQKQASAKPATVITDDTLHPAPATPAAPDSNAAPATPPAPGDVSAAVPPAAPGNASNPETAAQPNAKQADTAAEDADKKAKADALRQQIAEAQQRVNLLQREITLEQENFYRSPDYAHDKEGKEKLSSLQDELQQRQAELSDLKSQLADLGVPETPSGAAPPAQPQP